MKIKIKSILGILCGVCLLTATPVMASDIDLSSMSADELTILRDSVVQALADKSGDNIITQGLYEVGTDIKATNFKVFYYGNSTDDTDCVNFYIYNSKEDYDNYTSDSQLLIYADDKDGGILNLKEGQYILVSTGAAVIEEINPSWQP
ncbi:hypothetical protein [Blautia luti]|uniref:hypothetical protein n=1 Tax=Blautia luti TaxID=89014 RepID=UPI0018AA9FCD|nr:hypothetical protein [Blautia luti]